MNERIDELLKQVNFVKEHNITPSMKAVLLPCAFSMGKAIPLVDMREFTLGKYSLRMNIRFFCYASNEEAEKRGIL